MTPCRIELTAARLEQDLVALTEDVRSVLLAALATFESGTPPHPSASGLRARIEACHQRVGRRALGLLTASSATAANRRLASRSFNQGVMLSALADWAELLVRRSVGRPGAAVLAEAARRCVVDLGRAATAEVAALDLLIAETRAGSPSTSHAAAALEQMGELVLGLHATRSARRPALARA